MSGGAQRTAPADLALPGLHLVWGRRTYVMGIVNVTPDSFSGDGCPDAAAAVGHGVRLAEAGADLLDVGGESTRPGAVPVAADIELERVVPVVEGLRARGLPVSIDTSKPAVAEAACRAGAVVINDVSQLADPELAAVAARHGAALVIMHRPPSLLRRGALHPLRPYADVASEVAAELASAATRAVAAGVPGGRLIFDPGLGFGKTAADNLELLRRLDALPRPLLVGPSRKGFIGRVTGETVDDRDAGTAAAIALAVAAGADIVRVHDVRTMRRVVALADAVVRS